MNSDLLLDSVSKHISLTREEQDKLSSQLTFKKVKRKHFLLQEGEINRNAIFVTSGVLRLYSIDKNGFEHILQFAPPGWWIGDLTSFLRQQPANLNVDAVDDSEVLLLSRPNLEMLYETIPKLERFFRILAENALANYQQRLVNNLSLSAKERYDNFCKLYPSLIQCLPQKQVAAYIGVTPEFLSKMLSQAPKK